MNRTAPVLLALATVGTVWLGAASPASAVEPVYPITTTASLPALLSEDGLALVTGSCRATTRATNTDQTQVSKVECSTELFNNETLRWERLAVGYSSAAVPVYSLGATVPQAAFDCYGASLRTVSKAAYSSAKGSGTVTKISGVVSAYGSSACPAPTVQQAATKWNRTAPKPTVVQAGAVWDGTQGAVWDRANGTTWA